MSAKSLNQKYPPSSPCTCEICRGFCARPGWWTVAEATKIIQTGYAGRMMLEIAPDRSFGVLAPAFKGCEAQFAQQRYAGRGCTFLQDDLCELFGTGLQPLECRFCHHDRPGQGPHCHADLEKDWYTPDGASLVVQWSKLTGFWERINLQLLSERAKRAG
jgi:hypothetical protein